MTAPTIPASERYNLGRYHRPSHRWQPCGEVHEIPPRKWWKMFFEKCRDSTNASFRNHPILTATRATLVMLNRYDVDPLPLSLRRQYVGHIGLPHADPQGRTIANRAWVLNEARNDRLNCGNHGARLP